MRADTNSNARRWLVAAAVMTVFKLWLTSAQSIFAIGFAAHDDRLFLQLAEHLIQGHWLGPYDQMTLAKGPFYSLWAAFVFVLGVPLYFSQHLLYATACAAFVRACAPSLTSAAVQFALYAILLWNPMSYDASSLGRVLRQHVYSPQVILIFAGLIALYLRRNRPLRQQLPWAITLGLAGSAFYLTREEAIWLAPSAVLLIAVSLGVAWREGRPTRTRMLQALSAAALGMILPLLLVSAVNYHQYRWFGTVEFRASEFKAAYGAMTRVRTDEDLPFVPVTRKAREAMYAISPSFAKLRPHLEGAVGRGWAEASMSITKRPPEELEIAGGWMMWALRDAVAAAREAGNAGEAMAFYAAIAREINQACDDGRLTAGPHRSGFIPTLREGQLAAIGRTFVTFADFTLSYRRFSAYAPPSEGDESTLTLFRDITRGRLSQPPESLQQTLPNQASSHQVRVGILHGIGKILRHVFFGLFFVAQFAAAVRVAELIWRRRGSFALTVAAAAWGGGVAYLLITAMVEVTSYPILAVSSFAPIYSLQLLFISAVLWDVWNAWIAPHWRSWLDRIAPASHNREALPGRKTDRLIPIAGGMLALLPFIIWNRQFAELFWFGDDYILINDMAESGFWPWVRIVFAENFVPLFKILWGGAILHLGGSHLTMLGLLWGTHVVNTFCFGVLLHRYGLPSFAVAGCLIAFGLPPENMETLGWTVQWSAVLAMSFLLFALLWFERCTRTQITGPRMYLPLALLTAASALCFSRGVLTGATLCLATLLAGFIAGTPWRRQILPAVACMLPAVIVALIILTHSSGNHRNLSGHVGSIIEYAAGLFLLNPAYLLFKVDSWAPGTLLLLAAGKLAVVFWGFRVASGRTRFLLLLLLAYDLGNAVLIGIGRHHTGLGTLVSSRYYYGSLFATLPFAFTAITHGMRTLMPRPRLQAVLASSILLALTWHFLHRWPKELPEFVGWRGTELRALMAAPRTEDPQALVPAIEYMHVERAKALIRAYDLH